MNTNLMALCKAMDLNDSEAKIFSQILINGRGTASSLSKVSETNRATTYHALLLLEQRGLVFKQMINGNYEYEVSDSSSIDAFFEHEIQEIKTTQETVTSALRLFQKRRTSHDVSSVQVFQGIDAVKNSFEIAFQAKKKQWSIIAPKDNFLSHVDEAFVERYLTKRKRITTKTLWESNSQKPVLSKSVAHERNVRYLPREYWKKFTSLIILFDTSILFVAPYHEEKATLITSTDLSSTLHVLFDTAWENSTEPETT